MKYLDEFLIVFGDFTVSKIVTFVLACVFLYSIYNVVKNYFISKYEAQQKKDEELKEALDAVRKYPEYRQHSMKIQELLEGEIQELRDMLQENQNRLARVEEQERRRECNRLRDMLLQNYRYYTNMETNPSQSWTRMEAEAFWELFKDYEDLGGDGYMHTDVQPDMERLTIIEVGKR